MRSVVLALIGAAIVAPHVAAADDAVPAPVAPASEARPEAADGEAEGGAVEVLIVGDRAETIQKLPGSFTTLDRREIERAAPHDAAELLRRVPNLYVREDSAGGGRIDIGVRGLDPGRSRRLLVLEDGMPLAINPYAEPDLYLPPQLERVEKIEVLTGSGSILYGPQTIGGVINFVTRTPPWQLESFAQVDVGTLGFARTIGRFGAPIPLGTDRDPVRVLGQIVVKHQDGARDQPSTDHDALLKVALPLSPTSQLMVKLAAHKLVASSEDVGLTRDLFQADPFAPALAPKDKLELGRFDGSLVYDADLGEDVRLRVLGYGTVTDRTWTRQRYDRIAEPGVYYERVVGDPEAPLGAIFFRRDDARLIDRSFWVAGIEPRLTVSFRSGPVAHKVDAGLRVLGEHAREDDLDRSGDLAVLQDAETHTSLAFAAYAQDRLFVGDLLAVTPGVRVEHATYLRTIARVSGAETDVDGSTSVATVVPGIGMTLGVPEAHVFAGVHVGYAPPRATEAIDGAGVAALLEPERSTNWEIGARSKAQDWLATEATFFLIRFQNQIVPTSGASGATVLVNGGASETLGAEAAARARIGRVAKIDWDVDAGVRVGGQRATFLGSDLGGLRVPYAPGGTFTGTFDVDAPFGLGASFAGSFVGSVYTDPQNTELEDATGRVGRIPPYALLDASLRYHEQHTGLGVGFSAKNLLDRPVVVARRPEGIWPGGYRQFVLTLSYAIGGR